MYKNPLRQYPENAKQFYLGDTPGPGDVVPGKEGQGYLDYYGQAGKGYGGQSQNITKITPKPKMGQGLQQGTSSFFMDPRLYQQEGTAEADLYNLMLQSQQEQWTAQQQEWSRQEAELNRQLAADRRQTMEQVRNRRRGQLKSGLSQAQIANQEISSLLGAQEMRSDIARGFGQERGAGAVYNTAAQQQARAMQDLYGLAGGFNQAGAAMYAASVADPMRQAELYGQYKDLYGKDFTKAFGKVT